MSWQNNFGQGKVLEEERLAFGCHPTPIAVRRRQWLLFLFTAFHAHTLLPLVGALGHFGRFWWVDGRRLFRELDGEIAQAEARAGEVCGFDDQDRLRLREYLLLGAGLGEMFAVLRGRTLSADEGQRFLDLSLFAPLYDDLFDACDARDACDPSDARALEAAGADPARIRSLAEDCFAFRPRGFAETMAHGCLRRLIESLPAPSHRSAFLERFHRLFLAQAVSQRQVASAGASAGGGGASREACREGEPEHKPNALDSEALRAVTFEKGGQSALLYRALLPEPLRPGEEDALYRFGALVQLMDDVFDVHGDAHSGVRTLATTSGEIGLLGREYRHMLHEIVGLFLALDLPRRQTRAFLGRALLILSRGLVCLDHLDAVQRRAGGPFRPERHGFDELLCDMELPGNFLRGLRHCLAFRI